MSDLPKRLRASLRCDAINGDSFERSVCAKQMREAADSLERALAGNAFSVSTGGLSIVSGEIKWP